MCIDSCVRLGLTLNTSFRIGSSQSDCMFALAFAQGALEEPVQSFLQRTEWKAGVWEDACLTCDKSTRATTGSWHWVGPGFGFSFKPPAVVRTPLRRLTPPSRIVDCVLPDVCLERTWGADPHASQNPRGMWLMFLGCIQSRGNVISSVLRNCHVRGEREVKCCVVKWVHDTLSSS